MDMPRPFLTLHVFGAQGVGKTTLKTQWFESSQSRAISEVADVHIRIQNDCSYAVMDSIRDLSGLDGGRHLSFLIVYRPDNQESIEYSQRVLEKVYTTFDYSCQLDIIFLENHFEAEFRPHLEEPTEFPLTPSQRNILASRNPPQLWRLVITDSVLISVMLDSVVVQPLLEMLDHHTKEKCLHVACVEGRVQVVKLLVSTLMVVDIPHMLHWTCASLEKHLAMHSPSHIPTNVCHTPEKQSHAPGGPSHSHGSSSYTFENQGHSPKASVEEKLLSTARYLYNLEPLTSLTVVARSADKYPFSSLRLLQEFHHDQQISQNSAHFFLSRAGLTSAPTQWLNHARFTHIKLDHNFLTSLPTVLFQLPVLQQLNLTHNCLEVIPDVLSWNCPRLKELNVSFNRLVSHPYTILEGRRPKDQKLEHNLLSGKKSHMTSATEALLSLTGYNLYPCLCSLSKVVISHNPSLNQIPEWVCVLPSLTLLEMKGLPHVTRLTPHLAHCRSLCVIHLDTDHLLSPPPNLAKKGTRSILTYLRCQLRGSTPYRHIKLVIVGDKGAGKTTLFRQFVRGGTRQGSTPNMEVAAFDFPTRLKVRRDRPRITFHVIDFAGDEIYRCTHNCFLTYRTIYLCVWNMVNGKASLQRLCPWLHSIQACVPGSPVLLVSSHADRRPGLSGETILQWEEEILGKVASLKNKATARGLGFPPIMQSVAMDCLSREDVDLLLNDIYRIARQMRHPKTNVLLMSDPLPRSYQELQALVEVKVRSLCLERRVAPVLHHEDLVDYVRSLSVANSNGLEHDDEEFNLACRFLHEAGAIVHFKSQLSGVSDLYFLDPQWLFNALALVVRGISQGERQMAIVSGEWPQYLQSVNLSPSMYDSFLAMMEATNIIVSLDFNKSTYMVPSLLPDTPPKQYPGYDLSSNMEDVVVQYLEMDFLPPPLFPQLIARVLLYIRQLSAQLLSVSADLKREEPEEGIFPDFYGSMISILSTSSFLCRSQSFHLDQQGYLSQDDLNLAGQDDMQRLRKIWGLSAASLTSCATLSTRQKQLTEKLVAVTHPILHFRPPSSTSDNNTPEASSSVSSHSDQFASYSFWKNGLYCKFPCGTKFWLEACTSALALVVQGELVRRVKILSFLTSSVDGLVDECYAGLHVSSYSPCPSCLTRFWVPTSLHDPSINIISPPTSSTISSPPGSATTNVSSLESTNICSPQLGDVMSPTNFTVSGLDQSFEVTINEFSERILYLRRKPPVDQEQSFSFSGSNFVLSLSSSSSSPEPDSSHVNSALQDQRPDVALLDNRLTLFPLEATVQQSLISSFICCPSCQVRISLETLSPHVLLVDFKNSFLLNSKNLQFSEDSSSTLGKGGFGKVFRGAYRGEAVAVKVFRKSYHRNVLLRRYKDLRDELSIMSQLQHPRVVALVGVCLRPQAMVLKLAPLGTLRNHIDLCPHGMMNQIAHEVLYQIADGLCYLHSLYIVHRDIKPSNVLVWDLQPDHSHNHIPLRGRGVDVKLADYGVSQFYSPSGLRRHKGTEEYMAPELFRDNRKLAYDEKVDIFSFGLVLHAVVTGRRLFAGIVNKHEQLRLLYQADFPQLSAALAEALSDSNPLPTTSSSTQFPSLLDEAGRHLAARTDVISSCHSVCMQPLMESCLDNRPEGRPSAQGLCSSLLLCPGSTPQRDYYIAQHVSCSSYCPLEKMVVGLQDDLPDHVTLFPTDTWQMRRVPTPYAGEKFCCLHVAGREVFLASKESKLLYSFDLPSLQSGHILPHPLSGTPFCLFSYEGVGGVTVAVGMSGSKLTVFSSPTRTFSIGRGEAGGGCRGGKHLLERPPLVRQILEHPDACNMDVTCGVYHERTLWCGCGHYLVGLHPQDLLMKHYTRLKEELVVAKMAASHGHIWISYQGQSLLMVTTTAKPSVLQTIDCHSVLGRSSVLAERAVIRDLVAGDNVVWAGTSGGFLLGFHPLTADVLVVHRKSFSLTSILSLSRGQLLTFGRGILGLEEENELDERTSAMFTLWVSYITG